MNHHITQKSIVVLSLFFLCLFNLNAQNGMGITGGECESDSFRVSYSVGQIVFEATETDAYYISQGLQHPLVFLYTDIIESEISEAELLVYPNPAGENLYLSMNRHEFKDLSFKLFDMQGRILMDERIERNISRISVKQIQAGIYILKVYQDTQEFTSFKVLKK